MTDYPVNSGQTVTGFQLAYGDTQTVSSGGSIINTYAGTPISVYDLSNLPNTTIPGVMAGFYGAGGEVILNGGDSTDTTLNDGTESIYAGGVSNSATVGTVIQETSFSGYSQVLPGSVQTIHSGGVANNSLVMNGSEIVMNGGVSNNATLVDGFTENGSLGTSVFFDASQAVLSGGLANATTLDGGLSTISAGGTASATNIGYLGSQSVSGIATNTVITSGGTENIASGGAANGTTVDGAAPFTYSANSHYYFVQTSVAGGLNVQAGGTASRITVENGGNLDDFGSVDTTNLTGAKSMLTVEQGAGASFTSVAAGATENVLGQDFEVQVGQGGTIAVLSGGFIQGAGIGTGGTLSVASGASLTPAMFLGLSDFGLLANAGTIGLGGFHGDGNGDLSIGSTGALSNSGTLAIEGGTYQSVGSNAIPGAVTVASGGSIVNTGTITAVLGTADFIALTPPSGSLQIAAGAVLTNKGTLNAAGLVSVGGTLVLDPGQVTTGTVQGTASATLELAAGGAGTLTGLGSTYAGFGTVQVDAGANWTLSGTTTLAANETVNLQAGSTLTVTSDNLSNISLPGTINFNGIATAIINLPYGAGPSANITGFLPNDGLFLAGVSFDSSNPPHVTGDDINYSIFRGPNLNLQVGNAQGGNFAFSNTSNGIEIALEPAITALVAHPDKPGVLGVGSVVTFDLTPQVALTANTTAGLPTLSLNDGGTATFDQMASTSTSLVFRTTIAAGQNTTDLKVTGLTLGGGALVDAIGTTVDGSTVAALVGSDTGLAVGTTAAPPVAPTPPTTVTGGVSVIGGAGGTVFITPKAGSNSVTTTATGNDTVISQGTDTIQAGGGADVVYATGAAATVTGGSGSLTFLGATGNDLVVGGTGSNAIYGGSGTDTLFGGTGPSILVAGSGTGNLLLAGVGNTTLVGGLGKAVMMFGGPGADSFTGSSGGSDIMIGGAGGNSFSLTGGDVAFGGPLHADSFTAGNGEATIITGGGGAQVNLGSGTLTSFEGSGAVNYNAGKGEGGTTDIVGFTVHDHITLTDGFTAQDASTAFATATKGSFGTTLNLTDGTKITVFGVSLTATQVSVG